MSFLVCTVPVCPVRAEGSHRSEQVSQLLFGESCELIEKSTDFVKVRMTYDNYEGWCQANQLEETGNWEGGAQTGDLAGQWVNEVLVNGVPMRVPFASTIPREDVLTRTNLSYNGTFIKKHNQSYSKELKALSFVFLNTPYQWGGRSVFGIDCSGFTQVVFKCLGVPLWRDASQQVKQGNEVGFLAEVKCGDLAFFDNPAGKITHVGILLAPDTIIHAAGKVRIDTIDSVGIVNRDTGKRTHTLRLIKRIADFN